MVQVEDREAIGMRHKQRFPALLMLATIAILATLVVARVKNKLDEYGTGEATAVRPQQITEETLSLETEPEKNKRYAGIEMADNEYEELARIVLLEAGNQSAEGQQAVVEVIFNRVLHSGFPNTVHDVLHQGEGTNVPQFSTISRLNTVTPTQQQYDAIHNALYGKTILDVDVVFFSQDGENDRVWGQIGDHIFCREYIWE